MDSSTLLAARSALSPVSTGFGGITIAHNVASTDLVHAALAEVAISGGSVLKPVQQANGISYAGNEPRWSLMSLWSQCCSPAKIGACGQVERRRVPNVNHRMAAR